MKNKYNFVVLIFAKVFEAISENFIDERTMTYLDNSQKIGIYNHRDNSVDLYYNEKYKNTQNRLHNIVYSKINISDEKTHKYICEIINCRNYIAHPNEKRQIGCKLIKHPNSQHILNWFTMVKSILVKV